MFGRKQDDSPQTAVTSALPHTALEESPLPEKETTDLPAPAPAQTTLDPAILARAEEMLEKERKKERRKELKARVDAAKAKGKRASDVLDEVEFRELYGIHKPSPELYEQARAGRAARQNNQLPPSVRDPEKRKRHDEALDELEPLAWRTLEDNLHHPDVKIRQQAAIYLLNRKHGTPASSAAVVVKDGKDVVEYHSSVLEAMKEGEKGVSKN